MNRVWILLLLVVGCFSFSNAAVYYVNINGNDATGDGSQGRPWRTLRFAASRVPANQGHVIRLSGGTFIEQGPINIPTNVSIEGVGRSTVLKAASSFYYNPSSPGYSTDKFLLVLKSSSPTDGNQSIKNLHIDGDGKRLHGGIFVEKRDRITIDGVSIHYVNFNAIWFWGVRNSRITNCDLLNNAWASVSWCTGNLQLSDIENVEIDHVTIDESDAYGIKAIGSTGGRISNLKIHDCRISVNPFGVWNNGQAPNIALELYGFYLNNVEIYNNYVDNTISLVNVHGEQASQSTKTVHVHHNTLDMASRSKGEGYGLELTMHNAEVNHNHFIRGTRGIATWPSDVTISNWNIHHNVFYGFESIWPSEAVRSNGPLVNLKFNNNTYESVGGKTANVIGLFGGTSRNFEIRNNLIINSNTGYSYYPNMFIYTEPGKANVSGLQVSNNLLYKLDIGKLPGTYANNMTVNPQINATGNHPDPYYHLKSGSPCINAGVDVGHSYSGSSPDIGAFEYATTAAPTNTPPQTSISSPSDNSTFAAGSTITLQANAGDKEGSVTKVEFFRGTTKLGEDTSSPYSFTWSNVPEGNYSVTARATDNQGATGTSSPVRINVVGQTNVPPSINLTNPSNGANFQTGANVTLMANASDSDGTVSKVEFYRGTTKMGEDNTAPYSYVWSSVPAGSYGLTARATDNDGAVKVSATVTINVSNPNVSPSVVITSPSNNSTFTAGSSVTIAATASDPDGTITKVEFFSGSSKLGEDNTAPYSLSWANLVEGSYLLTAKATDNRNGTAISAQIAVNVGLATNSLPAISLTNPKNNATINSGDISIAAAASDNDGTISKVEFFSGTTKIGEDATAPYSFVWKNVKAGTYSLSARATDNRSGKSSSANTRINVVDPNRPPVVQITSPANNAEFFTGTAITVGVLAADSDGSIAKVEFFNGATLLGSDLASPYSFTWTNAPVGSRTIEARATDNKGATASAKITILVKDKVFVPVANAGPDMFLDLPENAATLSGAGQSENGEIENFEWAQKSGPSTATITATGTPGEVNVSGLEEGTYVFVLTVTDNKNATDTDEMKIDVNQSLTSLKLPRVFSPNGDGINDVWEWGSDSELLGDARLMIFNRFGQKVYEAISYDNSWDGSINGKPLQEDAYYYVISSNRGEVTGAVRIVR